MADRMRVTSLMEAKITTAGDLVQGGSGGSLPACQLEGWVGRLPHPPQVLDLQAACDVSLGAACQPATGSQPGQPSENGTARVVLLSAKTRSSAATSNRFP